MHNTSHVVIDIRNCTKQRVYYPIALRKAVFFTLQLLKVKKSVEVSVVLVGEQKMRTLNRMWRGIDNTTDVLSFGFLEKEKYCSFPVYRGERMHMGEIFICFLYAKRQAKKQNISLKENLITLVTHGIVHLYGIDHTRSFKENKKTMQIQKEVLRQIHRIKN